MGAVVGAILVTAAVELVRLFSEEPPAALPVSAAAARATGLSPVRLRADAQRSLGLDSVKKYNLVFAGRSGAGKSTLINALCGLEEGDEGAAAVGELETTQRLSSYSNPEYKSLLFWDLPGYGTRKHSEHGYFMEKKLFAFDFIFIVSAGRFTEADYNIAKSAKHFEVPFAFIRAKADVDIDNRSRRLKKPKHEIKDELATEIRRNVEEQLPSELRTAPVFVLSSFVVSGILEAEPYGLDERRLVSFVARKVLRRRGVGADFLAGFQTGDSVPDPDTAALGPAAGPEEGALDGDGGQGRVSASKRRREALALGLAEAEVDMVLVGAAAAGKSSLINAICGLDDDDSDAAPVDTPTEGLRPFRKEGLQKLVFWDSPGYGTPAEPAAGFFTRHKIFAFDFVWVVSAGRFREADLDMALAAQRNNISVALVRTQLDVDVDSRARRRRLPKADVRQQLALDIRQSLDEELPEQLRHVPVFVVSARVISGELERAEYGADERRLRAFLRGKSRDRRPAFLPISPP